MYIFLHSHVEQPPGHTLNRRPAPDHSPVHQPSFGLHGCVMAVDRGQSKSFVGCIGWVEVAGDVAEESRRCRIRLLNDDFMWHLKPVKTCRLPDDLGE
jgi:hypothetical protein